MVPLVKFPELVEHYAPYFADIFSAAAWVEFKRYISGLLVSENKTVDGINRLFVEESRNQSSLNRLLTQSPFSLEALNEARLKVLASQPETQLKAKGVLGVDDTLLKHYGEHFEHIAYLYDSADECYAWAHNLVTLHYSDDATDYPLLFEVWKPPDLAQIEAGLRAASIPLKASKERWQTEAPAKWRQYVMGVWRRHSTQPEVAALYDSKLRIAEHLLAEWVRLHPNPKLPVTFDSWYTQPGFCQYLDRVLNLHYVGTLTSAAIVRLKTGEETVAEFAKRLKVEHLAAVKQGGAPVFRQITIRYKGETDTYYTYCATHHIATFGKVRLVINHREADLSDNPVFYISNCLRWQAEGITRIRRHRWPVEVYYEEGKAEGLDQYQLRDFSAIERHIALVAVVYSLLRAAQHDTALRHQLQRELQLQLEGSAPFWRRVSQAHCLWSLAVFLATGLAQGHSLQRLMAPFLRAVCAP
jgi:hypothetical protein